MGSEDRDYWRKNPSESSHSDSFFTRFDRFTQKTSMVWIAVFWLLVMGALYLAMTHYSNQRRSVVIANGELTVAKDRDGHFYIPSSIQGQPVMFLVDTGATLTSVSNDIAQLAKLPPGEPAQFNTAGGTRTGTIVSGVTLQVGPFTVSNMRVGTGLDMSDTKNALLGQNFLSKFNTQINNDTLTLSARSGS
jgi:aspartyl protease family protein